MTESDPGCVKTHTSAKCGKYNSPILYGAVGAQHDLTLRMRPSSEMFYARRRRASFHTAKTQSGHRGTKVRASIDGWFEAALVRRSRSISAKLIKRGLQRCAGKPDEAAVWLIQLHHE